MACTSSMSWPSVRWSLTVAQPTAARAIDSARIAVRPTPQELQVYKGAQWAKRPSEMLEDAVLRLGGIKSLYSDAFFTREVFDRTYGMDSYERLKARYDPQGRAPHLFDKCVRGA